jgi:gliding motility-associated-like protein
MNALPVPTLTSSDPDNTFCAGTSVTFTASGGTSYDFRAGAASVQNGASATYTTSSLTNGQIVSVIVSNAAGCTATSTGITNIVNTLPTANAGSGGNECDLTFTLNAVPSIGTGTWTLTTGPGTASFAPNANSPTATVTVSEYGTYTFTWTEVIGTCSRSSVITVNFYLQPVVNAGAGGNNCGLEFYLNGSLNIGTGTWSKVSGPGNVTFTPDANVVNPMVAVTSYGSYTFRFTGVNGTCSNNSTVTVNFILQAPANAGSGGNECDLDFIMKAVATIGTGTWSKVSGPGNAIFTPDSNQTNATVTVDQVGTYDFAWTVVNSTCTSSDIVRVVFHELPIINAGADTAICKNGNIQLHAQGTGSFSWVPAASVSNPDIPAPVAAPDTTTTYLVTLTDLFGCKNTDNIKVEVRVNPVANAGPDQILEYMLETQLDAVVSHSYEKGIWSQIAGTGEIFDTTYAKSSVSGLSLDMNTFLWTVTNGVCPTSSDSVNITVNNFIIPTLITPNLDGLNDYFILSGLTTFGRTELLIFDRRGARVYRNPDYDNSWDGVDYNNNPLPDDTYFYVIKTENGKSLSGYIVIRR